MATVIYYLCVGTTVSTLSYLNIGFDRWEWWVMIFMLITARICGKEEAR